MGAVALTTYRDLLDHLVDFVEGDVSAVVERDARRSVQNAYRDLPTRHPWTLYYNYGRINTVAPYETGTVEYDHTGGLYERMLTLTDGTWPDWASLGFVLIDSVRYEVADRKSTTVLTLSVTSNPGDDVDAGEEYSLRRDTYPMPSDFVEGDEFMNVNNTSILTYAHPRQWLERKRVVLGPGFPSSYTFVGDPNYFGCLAVGLDPAPDAAYALDFLYKRRPRPLKVDGHSTGTVTINADEATVTGAGTAFADRLVGSVFRVASSATQTPTGLTGSNAYEHERVIVSVDSATQLTLDSTVPDSYAAVKYMVSDPVDVEDGAMLNALLSCCEYYMARARNMKDRAEIEQHFQRQLTRAREADRRSTARRSAGDWNGYGRRLSHFPAGDDVE
jgi:hypothetical protein